MVAHRLSRRDARRIAVRAQLLTRDRPTDLLATVDHLGVVPLEPTAAVASSTDLVLWSRLGAAYDPLELDRLLAQGRLVEHRTVIRPAHEMALYRDEMDAWPGFPPLSEWQESLGDWVEANDEARREILFRLADGPLATSELPDLVTVPWRSSGWTNDKNLDRLLALMVQRGEVAVTGRGRGQRLWDLAERVYPDDPVVPHGQAVGRRHELRLRAVGIDRAKITESSGEPTGVGAAGEEAVVEGTTGTWRVDPSYLGLVGAPWQGRAALLSPHDRLVGDRKRLAELFEFDYLLEMYKPAARRRWGYFALPVLYGDRLVGKLDSKADRKAGVYRVHALHWDVEPTTAMRAAVDREIRSLATWLDLDLVREDHDEVR